MSGVSSAVASSSGNGILPLPNPLASNSLLKSILGHHPTQHVTKGHNQPPHHHPHIGTTGGKPTGIIQPTRSSSALPESSSTSAPDTSIKGHKSPGHESPPGAHHTSPDFGHQGTAGGHHKSPGSGHQGTTEIPHHGHGTNDIPPYSEPLPTPRPKHTSPHTSDEDHHHHHIIVGISTVISSSIPASSLSAYASSAPLPSSSLPLSSSASVAPAMGPEPSGE